MDALLFFVYKPVVLWYYLEVRNALKSKGGLDEFLGSDYIYDSYRVSDSRFYKYASNKNAVQAI